MIGRSVLQVVVATDWDRHEAIYVDGRKVFESGHAYAIDIATATLGRVMQFRHVNVDLPENASGFPATLDELQPLVSPIEPPLEFPRLAVVEGEP